MQFNLADVFGSDIFNAVSLTDSINKLPNKPSKLGDMGLFASNPTNTTTAVIEERQGVLSLIQTSARGTRGVEMKHAKRKARAFVIPHIAAFDQVLAAEVQGIREFGASVESLETVAMKVALRLQTMKDSIDLTKEWHRVGAIQGLILDADGTSVIYDLFAEFGITRDSHQFDFGATPTTDIKVTAQVVTRNMIKNLGGTPFTGIQAICGDNFWDGFISSPSVKEAYKNYASNTMLQQQQRNGFMFADIYWMNYTGYVGTGGSTNIVPTEEAQFFPIGAGSIMQEILAPADTTAAVNTLGLPYYASQEILPHDKGIDMEAQSNPLYMVTRPACLIQGTHN